MKKLLVTLTVLVTAIFLVGCGKDNTPLSYIVTFDSAGGTAVDSQTILNGGKVTKPEDPTRDGYVFEGEWMNGSFTWDFDIDIVTEDITLTASWIEVSTTPTNIEMSVELFSSNLTWLQQDADLQTFTVSIKAEDETSYTEVSGEITIEDNEVLDVVIFTPDVVPQGGYYTVKIDTALDSVTSDALLFGGAGTELNPYRVSMQSDITAILDTVDLHDKYFMQVADVLSTLTSPIEINNDRKASFSGSYDGGGYEISFTGNGGLFHEITENGMVSNLVINEATVLSAAEENLYAIGAIADDNYGVIENVESSASLTNVRLQGELPVFAGTVDTSDLTTGAGGLVGVNRATGTISQVNISGSGAVKAGRGNGGVAAYNFGLIEEANVTATLPAGNQANSGKSSNTYSYGGGIAGFNFGTITMSNVSGRVFAQSAYSASGDGNEGKNIAFGGIAGYNEGIISLTSFARTMASKEFIDKSLADSLGDSANNLGVASIHGDLYVGGIAGINAGTITDTYVGGALIGGRDFVGGVTGLTLGSGNILNTYVFAEVAVKDDGGLKITEANAKTTATTYEIAPSGFDTTSTVYKPLVNSSTSATWMPGDADAPELPEFTSTDLEAVGSHFVASGVLNWQSGTVTGVDVLLETIAVPYMEIVTLEYTVYPTSAPDQMTTWTSSDEAIVEVLGDGQIKGVNPGTATITVTTRDGGFTDTIEVTVEDYEKVTSYTVDTGDFVLPEANNSDVRDEVEIGTVVTFTVSVLPETAKYQGYTISSSNSRAEVDGNTVTFVYGNTGPGSVSIYVTFEDSSVETLNYRFKTVEAPLDYTISADTVTLPEANDAEDKTEVFVDTVAVFSVEVNSNITNQNYTIMSSNDKATVDGNTVTFVLGSGAGDVSITVSFEDTTIGDVVYVFTTLEATAATSYTIDTGSYVLPEANNSDDRQAVDIGTTVTFAVVVLPENATYQGYTITTSNSRATVDGNTVTFQYGNTGPGSVSIYVTFDDPNLGKLNFRFTTVDPNA